MTAHLSRKMNTTAPSYTQKEYFDYDVLIKTIMVGDSCVGKSSLLYRYSEGDWNPHYLATIGVDFKTMTFEKNGKIIKLQMWDTAGQERFRTITNTYYRGCHGVVLVFDYTNRESFQHCESRWMVDVERCATLGCPVILLGNKADVADDLKEVTDEEAQMLARRIGVRLTGGGNGSSSTTQKVEGAAMSARDLFSGRSIPGNDNNSNSHRTPVANDDMCGDGEAIPFFKVSAKYDTNVEEAFGCVVETCVHRRLEVLEKKNGDVDEERRKRRVNLKETEGRNGSSSSSSACIC